MRNAPAGPTVVKTGDRDAVPTEPPREESRDGNQGCPSWGALSVSMSLGGLYTWELASDTLEFSDRYAELLGYAKAEIPGTIDFFWNAIHPADEEAVRIAVQRCLQCGERTTLEHRLRTQDGEYRWFQNSIQAQWDVAGRAVAIVGVLQDVHEVKCAEMILKESESCFRSLCERSLAGIYIIQDGCFQYVNRAVTQMLDREPDELLGVPPLSLVHPDDRALVQECMRVRLCGEAETSRYETRYLRRDGTAVPVEVLGARADYRGRPALVGAMLDISDRKQAETARDERIRFEELLADLSAGFVNVSSDRLGEILASSLKRLVEFLGNDRSALVQLTGDTQRVLVTHSYAVAPCEPFARGWIADETLPWYIGQLRAGKSVFLRCLPDDLPPEAEVERRYGVAHGIQSSVAIPLQAGSTILGAITFGFLRQRCEWPAEIICRLRVIGEVFAGALQRQRADETLRTAIAENEKLRMRLEQENEYLREQVVLKHQHGRVIGQSESLKAALAAAERVAATSTPVLLLGETGTGKELLAQTIHELSDCGKRAMVIVNCASLPPTLVESELFGREAGAYTGAVSAQVGRFVMADGSTLFLDEIGEFPVELQAKLLRVLQDGRFERVGSPKTVTVNVRIIAATNRNLEQAVRDGTFRADLYHRLNVFPIRIPPLRERPEDIPLLAWNFVETIGRRMGKTIQNIPRRTMDELRRYAWPGNVRELSNVIERAMILATGDTLRVEIPSSEPTGMDSRRTLKEIERTHILRTLQETAWRIRGSGGAAEILGMKPTTLEARIARLGIARAKRTPKIS